MLIGLTVWVTVSIGTGSGVTLTGSTGVIWGSILIGLTVGVTGCIATDSVWTLTGCTGTGSGITWVGWTGSTGVTTVSTLTGVTSGFWLTGVTGATSGLTSILLLTIGVGSIVFAKLIGSVLKLTGLASGTSAVWLASTTSSLFFFFLFREDKKIIIDIKINKHPTPVKIPGVVKNQLKSKFLNIYNSSPNLFYYILNK